ncbi:MAG: TVP38/TMEM64 family protein [Clostridiales bacterium]|jgi:uncharacterized membrane protein YdjX (TVP38/TMEM64 family)|nr:TVP38/TMEM64 family protein [Clostridiales bacterium]
MKDIKKTSFIVVTIGAVLLAAGGLLLSSYLKTAGFAIAGASVVLYIAFLFVLKKGKEPLIKLAITVYVFGIFLVVVLLILAYTGFLDFFGGLNEGELKEYIARSPAPKLMFILLQFLQVTFIPIPSTASTVAGALLWQWESVWMTLIGVLLGSLLAFGLGRWLGEKVVKWIVGQETLDKYYGYVKGKDKTLLFLMFLLPVFPDDALCVMAGLTNMKVRTFMLMMLISRPIQAVSTVFTTLVLKDITIPKHLQIALWIAAGIAAVLLFFFVFKNGAKIEKKMLGYADALRNKKDEILGKFKKTALYKRVSASVARRREKFENGAFYKKYAAWRAEKKRNGGEEKEDSDGEGKNDENAENDGQSGG